MSSDLISDAGALLDTTPRAARRDVLRAGALGLGFAAAAGPVAAQAIRTPSDGLTVGEVMIDVGASEPLPAYRAAPAGRTGLPTILVVHEVFGVHEYIADTCRRFAQRGFQAIAPELFFRQGDPMSYGELAKLMSELVAKVPDEQVLRDLDAVLGWSARNGGDGQRLSITGFCWGGRIAWLYAAHQPQLRAAVAWYGRLAGTPSALTPRHPIDVAAALRAPVLGLYGGADAGIPLQSVDAMKTALAAAPAQAARRSRFAVYPDAPHAFHADYRPSFRREPAEDGWRQCLEWLRANGAA